MTYAHYFNSATRPGGGMSRPTSPNVPQNKQLLQYRAVVDRGPVQGGMFGTLGPESFPWWRQQMQYGQSPLVGRLGGQGQPMRPQPFQYPMPYSPQGGWGFNQQQQPQYAPPMMGGSPWTTYR